MIAKSYFAILKIGLGGSYYKIFLNPFIVLYIALDSFLGYTIVNLSNNILVEITSNKIVLNNILLLIFLPIFTNVLNLLFYNVFLKKKLHIIYNILNYIEELIFNAPNDFHDKFNINEKYHCLTSSIWGFDSIFEIIISMCSSLIKILTISISISVSNYGIGLLIIASNIFLLHLMPKINKYLEKFKDTKSHKEYYSSAYYNTLIFEENRVNPILQTIQYPEINKSLENIVSRYSKIHLHHKVATIIRSFIKNALLTIILIMAFYQEKYNYIMIILLNRNILFGFSNFYEDFKKTENSNKKNMEELIEMLEFLEKYYNTNKQFQVLIYNKIKPGKITISDMCYEYIFEKNLVKKLYSDKLSFDFNNPKNIVLISGKTGAGKSLFTKILSGQTDIIKYTLFNDSFKITDFKELKSSRIVLNQKISEEYTYNGSIKMPLYQLYPNSKNFDEIKIFLQNFGIVNKINTDDLYSEFSNKLSGGERQRVVLSSIIWKTIKTNPSFLIVDEPEKGIDEETMIFIMDWIVETYKGIIFLITHNETIKKKYNDKIQSIIKYKFVDDLEIITEMFQEFL
jgi:ABC-type multidrug transport system ATPase subunit